MEQYSTSELQQIFSNVCHELQSPLLGILGNLDLLKTTIKEAKEKAAESGCDDLIELLTEVDEYIHGIQLSTNHQITVTGKILSISKLDAGKVVLRQKLFCPHDTINDIVSVFKANLNANQKIVIQLPEEELWVEGDETQLKQIIINLLNNAIKFTQQGTITLSLTCKTDSEESCYLFFTVQDSGIGMSESEQKNLFQRYSQANKFITEQFGGSGLGLAICKRLVELMGGTISVSSEKGVGTSFSFSVRCQHLASTSTKVPITIILADVIKIETNICHL
jgi:signal transduction histidine kinase